MWEQLANIFTGGAASKVVGGVVNFSSILALAPAAMWLVGHKDEILTTVTYGQAAILGGLFFGMAKIAYHTKAV